VLNKSIAAFPQKSARTQVARMSTAEATQHLLASLESALSASPHVPRNRVRLEHRDGRVVVRGRVTSYYQKQMAQEALLRVEGVELLENQLEVHWA
jgi:osmotically-inducible protein OsmY